MKNNQYLLILILKADVQQISMRIIFVLKVQQSLMPFVKCGGKFGQKYLSLQFESYNHTSEFRFVRFYLRMVEFVKVDFLNFQTKNIKILMRIILTIQF